MENEWWQKGEDIGQIIFIGVIVFLIAIAFVGVTENERIKGEEQKLVWDIIDLNTAIHSAKSLEELQKVEPCWVVVFYDKDKVPTPIDANTNTHYVYWVNIKGAC